MANKIRKEIEKKLKQIDELNEMIQSGIRERDAAIKEMEIAEESMDADGYVSAKEKAETIQAKIDFHEKKRDELTPLITEAQAVELWKEESGTLLKKVEEAERQYKKGKVSLCNDLRAYASVSIEYFSKRREIWELCAPDWRTENNPTRINEYLGVSSSVPRSLDLTRELAFFRQNDLMDADEMQKINLALLHE